MFYFKSSEEWPHKAQAPYALPTWQCPLHWPYFHIVSTRVVLNLLPSIRSKKIVYFDLLVECYDLSEKELFSDQVKNSTFQNELYNVFAIYSSIILGWYQCWIRITFWKTTWTYKMRFLHLPNMAKVLIVAGNFFHFNTIWIYTTHHARTSTPK